MYNIKCAFNNTLLVDKFDASAADLSFVNIVRKEETAHDEQFPLLPQCFQLYSMATLSYIHVAG